MQYSVEQHLPPRTRKTPPPWLSCLKRWWEIFYTSLKIFSTSADTSISSHAKLINFKVWVLLCLERIRKNIISECKFVEMLDTDSSKDIKAGVWCCKHETRNLLVPMNLFHILQSLMNKEELRRKMLETWIILFCVSISLKSKIPLSNLVQTNLSNFAF